MLTWLTFDKERVMKKLFFTAALCLIYGCAVGPSPIKRFVSPAKAAYDKADIHFQNKDYSAAIAAYEKFIKDYPQNNLVPGAYLGIAWSHYLRNECQETLAALANVRTQEKSLKAWVDKLQQECRQKVSQSPEAAQTPGLFNIPAFTNQEKLKVEGTLPAQGKVMINGQEATIANNMFSLEIALKEGENALDIAITDKEGKTDTKQAKITLDRSKPQIKITSAELDDFGYAQLEGTTKIGSQVTAEDEPLVVDNSGKFSGRVKFPSNKQIQIAVRDKAGNTASEVFTYTNYPDRPTGLRLRTISGTQPDIEWNENREEDLKGYNVYYSLPGGFSDRKNNREIITTTTYTVTDLRSGKTYKIYLRAINKMGNESEASYNTLTVPIP